MSGTSNVCGVKLRDLVWSKKCVADGKLEMLDPLPFHPFDPKEPRKPKVDKCKTQKAAEAAGFRSRLSKAPKPAHQLRRRRTGRNVEFNLKAKPETIKAFCKVVDANGWGLGETLEYAVDLLAREQGIWCLQMSKRHVSLTYKPTTHNQVSHDTVANRRGTS